MLDQGILDPGVPNQGMVDPGVPDPGVLGEEDMEHNPGEDTGIINKVESEPEQQSTWNDTEPLDIVSITSDHFVDDLIPNSPKNEPNKKHWYP